MARGIKDFGEILNDCIKAKEIAQETLKTVIDSFMDAKDSPLMELMRKKLLSLKEQQQLETSIKLGKKAQSLYNTINIKLCGDVMMEAKRFTLAKHALGKGRIVVDTSLVRTTSNWFQLNDDVNILTTAVNTMREAIREHKQLEKESQKH